MTTMRALTESEVAFRIDLEPEQMKAEFDNPETMRFIRERLANEQHEAWCSLTVTATWVGPEGRRYTGTATLGGVSIDAGQNASGMRVARYVEKFAKQAELYDEALNELNEGLRARIIEAAQLIDALKIGGRP